MSVTIKPVVGWTDDIGYITKNLREVDVTEIMALSRQKPELAVRAALGMSSEAYVGYLHDEPVAVLGAHTTVIGSIAVPWLLGTDKLTRGARPFVRMGKRFVDHLSTKHSRLVNVVHDENQPSKAYLQRIGFVLSDPYTTQTGAIARTFTKEGYHHV